MKMGGVRRYHFHGKKTANESIASSILPPNHAKLLAAIVLQ
jgi:hypothetical protein